MLNKIVRNFQAVTRNEELEGRPCLVVPMVMITEGVHNGSQGRLLYTAEELSKLPVTWNQKPVIVDHPNSTLEFGSACTPEEIDKRKIGVIMNTVFEEGKLKAEAWIDEERANAVDNRVLLAVKNNNMVEVSTGLFTENEDMSGEWNGEEYDSITKNYKPDHLAILLDSKGACSIDDGAGLLRLNEEADKITANFDISGLSKKQNKHFTNNSKAFIKKVSGLIENEMSFDDTRMLLVELVRATYPDDDFIWAEDVFDDYFVYERDGHLYRQDYSETNGRIGLDGLPVEVIKETSYVTINKENKTMDKKKFIDALIANEQNEFAEEDRKELMAMSEKTLLKTVPIENEVVANAEVEVVENEVVANVEVEAKPMTVKEYIAAAPPEMQPVLTNGIASYNADKKRLINTITSNENCPFGEDELKAKNVDELRKLCKLSTNKSTQQPPIFDGQGDGYEPEAIVDNVEADEDVLLPPVIEFTKN